MGELSGKQVTPLYLKRSMEKSNNEREDGYKNKLLKNEKNEFDPFVH